MRLHAPEYFRHVAASALQRLQSLIPAGLKRPVRVRVAVGSVASEIMRVARASQTDIVVVGTRHEGVWAAGYSASSPNSCGTHHARSWLYPPRERASNRVTGTHGPPKRPKIGVCSGGNVITLARVSSCDLPRYLTAVISLLVGLTMCSQTHFRRAIPRPGPQEWRDLRQLTS